MRWIALAMMLVGSARGDELPRPHFLPDIGDLPVLKESPPVRGVLPLENTKRTAYAKAIYDAHARGKTLVVFVGQDARAVGGCLTLRYDKLDQPSPSVLIRFLDGSWRRMRGEPTASEILREISPPVLQSARMPTTFSAPFASPSARSRSGC